MMPDADKPGPLTAVGIETPPPTPRADTPLFSGLGEWVESHLALSIAILSLVFLCAELGYSLLFPLWHDEIFTVSIAQAPSLSTLLHLTQTIDLNPPLSYLLTRMVFHIAGVGTLQARLPEMLGFALALVCVFLFVRRRAGPVYGLLAAAVLFSSRATEPAIDARPYGLLLGFGALALLAWQASILKQPSNQSTLANDLLLCVSCTALLLTHVFGLMIWGSIVVAEALHALQSRRLVPSRIIALALPLAATRLYVPLFRLHANRIYPPSFQASYREILSFYIIHMGRGFISLAGIVGLIAVIAGRQWLKPTACFAFTPPEWFAAGMILLAPAALICRLAHQQAAFFFRYGDFAVIGFSIAVAGLLSWFTDARPTPAALAAIAFLMFSSRWQDAATFAAQGKIFRHSEPAVVLIATQIPSGPDLPLVVNSGVDFIEMTYYEPGGLLDRTYYLTGGQIARDYTNASMFEEIPIDLRALQLRGNSESYNDFVRQHRHFYLLADDHDHPEDWLLRKLPTDGATLHLIRHVQSTYSYHERDLYDVSFAEAAE